MNQAASANRDSLPTYDKTHRPTVSRYASTEGLGSTTVHVIPCTFSSSNAKTPFPRRRLHAALANACVINVHDPATKYSTRPALRVCCRYLRRGTQAKRPVEDESGTRFLYGTNPSPPVAAHIFVQVRSEFTQDAAREQPTDLVTFGRVEPRLKSPRRIAMAALPGDASANCAVRFYHVPYEHV